MFLMHTERALSCHIRNRFMLTNLACPISRLRGERDYTAVQRLHHRQTRSYETKGWKDASEDNKWMIVQWETFSKSLNPRNIDKSVSDIRIRIRFPFESSFWISVHIQLQTHYPAGYPTGKPNGDHLCFLISAVASDVSKSFLSSQSHLKFFRVESESKSRPGRVESESSHKNCRVTKTLESLRVIGLQARVNVESHEISRFFYDTFFAMKWYPTCHKMVPDQWEKVAQCCLTSLIAGYL